MTAAHVRILHPEAPAEAGSLTTLVAAARREQAERHRSGFAAVGAESVVIFAGPPDDVPFGERLRALVAELPERDGLVVLGSGAVPLLTAADRERFVATARADERVALANNAFSGDIVGLAAAGVGLRGLPADLATDNALPRWLAEHVGYAVEDLRSRWRLGVDIDGPLDLIVLGGRFARSLPRAIRDRVDRQLAAVRAVVADPLAEVVVAGRTSPATLVAIERIGAARTRALVEERGLRTSVPGQRPPASVLGMLIDRDGPASLGTHLAHLGEAAVVDSRVLLAHRLGADERAWPVAEDRFASDLLLHESIADPWLAALTRSAAEAPIPVVLGGHTLVGPGLRLALRPGPRGGSLARPSLTVEPRAELRRDAPVDLSDVGEDAALVDRIRTEIRATGPMSFARFMDLALYDPDGGYYRSATARAGRAGDFITAPELHPIFGATLATGVVDLWERLGRPDPFVIREHGAGDGALAVALLGDLAAGPLRDVAHYRPIEVDPRRVDALHDRLGAAGLAGMLQTPTSTGPLDGVVIANEVLDALPVHRVRQRGDRLLELAVGLDVDDAFVEEEVEPTTPALAERLKAEEVALVDGQTAEMCLGLDAWMAAASADLARGALILIDYGAVATELYDPARRRDGTLRAYVRHQVHDDPFRYVGRQDLTAHVDVTAVEDAARRAGLTTLGITTQAEALISLGIEGRLQAIQADPGTTFEGYAVVRSALMRMLDPAAMGRFRVMVFGRGWPEEPDAAAEPLRILSFRQPERPRSH